MTKIPAETRELLVRCAEKYETEHFICDDPSRWMHEVWRRPNQEAMAFVSAMLSFGSRKAFMPKLYELWDWSGGEMDFWLRSRLFEIMDQLRGEGSYYRFFTRPQFRAFLERYAQLIERHGTLGDFVRSQTPDRDALTAARAISKAFAGCGVVPSPATSACKRTFMFLRWMVRSGSPVDLGIWADFIDRSTLLPPLDVHVLAEARRLGLIKARCASLAVARRLRDVLADVFPGDPLKGDFALFGIGVDKSSDAGNLKPKEQPS